MFKKDPSKEILTNLQLFETGKTYSKTLKDYKVYLFDRNYGLLSDTGNATTVDGYVYAIERIQKAEGCSFEELVDKASHYAYLYGTSGPKRAEGNTSRGTWRNALNRLEEFMRYLKLIHPTTKPNPNPVKKFW